MRNSKKLYKWNVFDKPFMTLILGHILWMGMFPCQSRAERNHIVAFAETYESRYAFEPENLQIIREQMLDSLNQNSNDLAAAYILFYADINLTQIYDPLDPKEINRGVRNYLLAKEIFDHLQPLLVSDEENANAMGAMVCQVATYDLDDHPRLKCKFLENAVEFSCRYETIELEDWVVPELLFLKNNIQSYDNCFYDKIISRDSKKYDPIEWSQEFEEVIHLAKQKAKEELADRPIQMGYCHAYWRTLKRILKNDYGIQWRSPSEMNPDIMFD